MIIIFSGISTQVLFASDKPYYFYNPHNNFGSERIFNPLTVMLNGSFDILRNGNISKNIFEIPYKTGFKNVIFNITEPGKNIKKYGWKKFRQDEIFNITGNKDKMQFLPNFSLHLIGNGMQYVKLGEWYDYHHYPYPYLLSSMTVVFYQLMNEVVENTNYKGSNVDPIADILIFNPLGFLLFSTDLGKQIFSKKFPVYDWSCQPFFNPGNLYLENAGQQFATKVRLISQSRYSIFMYWGVQTIFGVSYQMKNNYNISFGAGSVAYGLNEDVSKDTRIMTANMKSGVGAFLDKDNSLLASVIVAGQNLEYFRIEIFPGLFEIGKINPGFFMGRKEPGNLQIGITTAYFPLGFLHEF